MNRSKRFLVITVGLTVLLFPAALSPARYVNKLHSTELCGDRISWLRPPAERTGYQLLRSFGPAGASKSGHNSACKGSLRVGP